MAIIEMKNLWKEYGDQVVLERLNATVQEGEFVTIVGASGCGKTSFLKLLLGTEQASRGELLLDGQPLPGEPPFELALRLRRGLGRMEVGDNPTAQIELRPLGMQIAGGHARLQRPDL